MNEYLFAADLAAAYRSAEHFGWRSLGGSSFVDDSTNSARQRLIVFVDFPSTIKGQGATVHYGEGWHRHVNFEQLAQAVTRHSLKQGKVFLSDAPALMVYYTNHAGKSAWREIESMGVPHMAMYPPGAAGVTPIPPSMRWCVEVFMVDRGAKRLLCLEHIQGFGTRPRTHPSLHIHGSVTR